MPVDSYEIWNDDENEIASDILEETELPPVDEETGFTPNSFRTLPMWLVHFIVVMQAVFRLSDVVVNYFLVFFKLF